MRVQSNWSWITSPSGYLPSRVSGGGWIKAAIATGAEWFERLAAGEGDGIGMPSLESGSLIFD